MNFDFIKDIDVLNCIYKNCNNAEEIAISMPDQSMIASRKSAEALSKLLYLVAHEKESYDLTFADILQDDIVKKYLRNKEILDAFHFVRKHGNKAVHTMEEETSEEAINVLDRLHFVTGEVAKKMQLINSYPAFNPNIAVNKDAEYIDINDVDELVHTMFEEYLLSDYLATSFFDEIDGLSSPFQWIPGNVDLNEELTFNCRIKSRSTLTKIQEHFGFVALKVIQNMRTEETEDEITYDVRIETYGDNAKAASDLMEFVDIIRYDIKEADGFKISSNYSGPSLAPWFNDDVRDEFMNVVNTFGDDEEFTYKYFEFLYNHGSASCGRCENGEWTDLGKEMVPLPFEKATSLNWYTRGVSLYVDFDFDRHRVILDSLQKLVRESLPETELEFVEADWRDGEYQVLVDGAQWIPENLREIQNFLDKVNATIEPIKAESECSAHGYWYITEAPFGVATWEWTEDGFKVIGKVF